MSWPVACCGAEGEQQLVDDIVPGTKNFHGGVKAGERHNLQGASRLRPLRFHESILFHTHTGSTRQYWEGVMTCTLGWGWAFSWSTLHSQWIRILAPCPTNKQVVHWIQKPWTDLKKGYKEISRAPIATCVLCRRVTLLFRLGTSCELCPVRKGCRAAEVWLDRSLDLLRSLTVNLHGKHPGYTELHRMIYIYIYIVPWGATWCAPRGKRGYQKISEGEWTSGRDFQCVATFISHPNIAFEKCGRLRFVRDAWTVRKSHWFPRNSASVSMSMCESRPRFQLVRSESWNMNVQALQAGLSKTIADLFLSIESHWNILNYFETNINKQICNCWEKYANLKGQFGRSSPACYDMPCILPRWALGLLMLPERETMEASSVGCLASPGLYRFRIDNEST